MLAHKLAAGAALAVIAGGGTFLAAAPAQALPGQVSAYAVNPVTGYQSPRFAGNSANEAIIKATNACHRAHQAQGQRVALKCQTKTVPWKRGDR